MKVRRSNNLIAVPADQESSLRPPLLPDASVGAGNAEVCTA